MVYFFLVDKRFRTSQLVETCCKRLWCTLKVHSPLVVPATSCKRDMGHGLCGLLDSICYKVTKLIILIL